MGIVFLFILGVIAAYLCYRFWNAASFEYYMGEEEIGFMIRFISVFFFVLTGICLTIAIYKWICVFE